MTIKLDTLGQYRKHLVAVANVAACLIESGVLHGNALIAAITVSNLLAAYGVKRVRNDEPVYDDGSVPAVD